MLSPVILIRMRVGSQNLFKCAIGTFRLSIGLRMIRGRHVELGTESLEQICPEVTCEAWISIREQHPWKAMQSVNCSLVNRSASCLAVTVFVVGIKWAIFEKVSTTTTTES